MSTFLQVMLASLIVSAGGLIGVVSLVVNQQKLRGFLILLVGLAAGALMGGAFLHLLPEAVELLEPQTVFLVVLVSFVGFFLLEKVLQWRHCHHGVCEVHSDVGILNLIGDSIHNFLDGLILAGAFAVDIRLGWITTLAVALHEIPQEIGDFGVLLYAGWRKSAAIMANFAVALTAVLGAVIGYVFTAGSGAAAYLMPIAAGGFIYIAAADLLPEIRMEKSLKKSLSSFGIFLGGLVLMYVFTFLE